MKTKMNLNWGNFEANKSFLKKTGLLSKDKRILEIGSGRGVLVDYLFKQGYNVLGTEIDEDYIDFAKKHFDIKLEKMSGEDLKFDNDSFDIVLSFDVFEHIPNSDKHLQEVRRILKPSGHYLLQTPNKWTNIPFEIIKDKSFQYRKYHCSLHNYWELKNRFEKNGFSLEFYKIPVVNEFFKEKINKVFGVFGKMCLSILNPDKTPYFLRPNFYLKARVEK